MCPRAAAQHDVACCSWLHGFSRHPPHLWSLAAVCAGGRRPAREIVTREPAARSGRSRGPPWPCRHPPAPRQGPSRHSLLSPQPISHVIPPQPFQTLNLERWNCNVFQPSLKRHPIELRATFVRAMSWHTPGTATKPSSSLPVSSTGIPRGYPQALFGAGGYPQGFVSAWITRRHARSVDVDGPTQGPTKE